MIAFRGRRNLDGGEEPIADASRRAGLRHQAFVLLTQAALLTALWGAILLFAG